MTLYQHDGAAVFRFELIGHLSAELAREMESCWETASSTMGSRPVVVDVTSVDDCDDAGMRALMRMQARGARVESRDKNRGLLERLEQMHAAAKTSCVA